MDVRITSKETELKDIIAKAFEQVFVDGHALVETNSGDVSMDQNQKFEDLQDTLYGLLSECLEQNLHEVTITNESAMAKFSAPKQVLEIDYDDFNEIVEGAYGGSYEVVAEQELNNGSILDFNVPNVATFFKDDAQRIRMGRYMPYEISKIVQCLFEDGFINEGEYQIRVSW